MELADMSPFVKVHTLEDYVNSHEQKKELSTILASFLEMSPDREVCLPNIAEKLDASYS
jgi:hypothetical protein